MRYCDQGPAAGLQRFSAPGQASVQRQSSSLLTDLFVGLPRCDSTYRFRTASHRQVRTAVVHYSLFEMQHFADMPTFPFSDL